MPVPPVCSLGLLSISLQSFSETGRLGSQSSEFLPASFNLHTQFQFQEINCMMTSTLDIILSFKYILGTLGLLADDLGCFIWFEDGDRVAPALKFGCSLDDGFDATCFGTECFFSGFSPDLELAPSLNPAWF